MTPSTGSSGLGGLFGSLGAIIGPLMMLAMALRQPGPVRRLLKAHADAPERARRPSTLGLTEPPLQPLIRAGVVMRDAEGCVWVDRVRARRRAWRLGFIFGGAFTVLAALVALVLRM